MHEFQHHIILHFDFKIINKTNNLYDVYPFNGIHKNFFFI